MVSDDTSREQNDETASDDISKEQKWRDIRKEQKDETNSDNTSKEKNNGTSRENTCKERMTHEAVTVLDTNKKVTGGRRCLNQPRPGNNANIKDCIALAVAITLWCGTIQYNFIVSV